jgi:peptidoglycan L-alanyl-D-glutamate endopeptidase CwlK
MDMISEQRLGAVHPELARRVRQLAQKCENNGMIIRVTQGLRTWAEQGVLFDQGRTKPGPIVTKAMPGHSGHNFGYCVDICPDKNGFPTWTPDWDKMDVRWKQVLLLARSCGLAEGATWRTFPDFPHLYLSELPADPDDNMRSLFTEGGYKALWADWKLNVPETISQETA